MISQIFATGPTCAGSCTSVRTATPNSRFTRARISKPALETGTAIGTERGAVGLVKGSFEDERNSELTRKGGQPLGHHQRVTLALDDARPGNHEEWLAASHRQLSN